MKDVIYIIVLSVVSITTIFILTKLMGYRQMSQMSMFDYVNGITIGSIAAELATSLEDDFVQPLTAMIVFAAADILLSWLTSKSIKVRRAIEGTPLILMNHGELYKRNLDRKSVV